MVGEEERVRREGDGQKRQKRKQKEQGMGKERKDEISALSASRSSQVRSEQPAQMAASSLNIEGLERFSLLPPK
ncbi:uncharacterized protein V6R79_008563, partial [Siganus canaliculatus]